MTPTRHWSDPLTPAEIAEVASLVRADPRIGERPRFWGIAVEESLARSLADGQGRPVRLVVMNPDAHAAWEVTAWTSGTDRPASLGSWSPVDAKRPGVSSDEARMIAQAARNHPLLVEALAKRGITDTSLVWVDPESITGFEPEDLADRRLSWGTVWHRESPTTTVTRGPSRVSCRSSISKRSRSSASKTTACSDGERGRQLPLRHVGPRPHGRAPRDHPAGGPGLPGRWPPRDVAELVVPDRLHAPRGSRAA